MNKRPKSDIRITDLEKPGVHAIAQILKHSILTTRGDVLYRSADHIQRLSKGTAGQRLKIGANDPEWANLDEVIFTGATELTLDTDGEITVTQVTHTVDTFEGAASDDLVTINGGATTALIILRAEHTDRTIVIKHGTGNIWLKDKVDLSLDDVADAVILIWDGTRWFDVGPDVAAQIAVHVAAADPHTGYIKESEFTASEDILVGTGAGTLVKKTPAELIAILSGEAAADFAMNSNKITGVTDPAANQDAATKKYVDDNEGLANIVEDTTPQLGGDLDLNSKNIDFPSTANVSDCKDEDDMASDSATMLATQQSIKAYADTYKASVTTATMTVYVDAAATGAADGTSWTDAFTTIQAAWDSLLDIIAHAVTIEVRKGTNPYRETVTISAKYVIASVTIEGEYYWQGDCEANVGGAGEITDTGAFGDVAVGDKVLIIDLNGANGRCQNYEYCTVDSIANAPNRIGTDGTLTPTTGWDYVIVRTEISGSDNGTDGGTARDYCFYGIGLDNITIQGFYVTFSDSYALNCVNCRTWKYDYNIHGSCDRSIAINAQSYLDVTYCYLQASDASLVCGAGTASSLDVRYSALVGPSSGSGYPAYVYRLGILLLAWVYIDNALRAAWALDLSWLYISYSTIANTATTGLYARGNSNIKTAYLTNSAGTPVDPVGTSEGAYIS